MSKPYSLTLGFGKNTQTYELPDQQAVSKVTHALRGALHVAHGKAIASGDNSPIPGGPMVPVTWSVVGGDNNVNVTGHQDIPCPTPAAQDQIWGMLQQIVAVAEKQHGHKPKTQNF